MGHYPRHRLPQEQADIRLVRCWVWKGICPIFILGSRLSTQLHVSVSILFRQCGVRLTDIESRYFVVGQLASTDAEVIRIAGLLRGTESAVQAVSYGLNSINIFADVGGVYLNFGLWGLALFPGWLVVKEIGVSLGDRKLEREGAAFREREAISDAGKQ